MKTLYGICLVLFCFSGMAQIGQKINNKPAASPSLEGTWIHTVNNQDIVLLFYGNGSGEFEGENITYTAANGKLSLKNNSGVITYGYTLNGNKLTLSGGDLQKPATFTRSGSGNATNNMAPAGNAGNAAANNLLGSWEAQGVRFTFLPNGKLLYNDKTMNYTVNGSTLYCNNAEAGVEVTYQYEISQGHLLLNYNGNTVMLKKAKGGNNNNDVVNNPAPVQSRTSKPAFLGSWVSTQNNQLTMMEGGKLTLDGYDLSYTWDARSITLITPDGNMTFSYTINGDNFNVTYAGITTYYKRVKGGAASTQQGAAAGGGSIDRTMVGRWGREGASGGGYNSSGGSNYSEYFILNGDGTYEYYGESSRAGYGGNMYGGASGSGGDRGTWRVKGNTIIAVSKTQGTQYYTFEKRNNKYGDPCIVLDGTEYVSYYKKAPWPNY
ncbi:MAG: hypothetical protein JNM68_17005 [Dinghuibacter sp.]|nr:hypothetical protein [Dinghuibacter sp.]